MASSPGNAVIPVAGGLALIFGGSAALFVDRVDMLQDEDEPRPIYVRYTSQATFDLRKRPHWIFLGSVILFSTCLLLTAQWQKNYMLDLEPPSVNDTAAVKEFLDRNTDIASQLQLFSIGCATSGFLVALLPMGNLLGGIAHTVAAAVFASFGANYSFRVRDVAKQADNSGLASFRFAVCMLVLVGCVLLFPSLWPAIVATGRLQEHRKAVKWASREVNVNGEDNNDDKILSLSQLQRARLSELVLACGQICIAVTMGVCLVTGFKEASTVEETDIETWLLFGLLPLSIMIALTGLFWWQNDRLFEYCQSDMLDEDEQDEGREVAHNEAGNEVDNEVDNDEVEM